MRAKDIHMAAKVDEVSRTVLVSGAIDQNNINIVLRIKLPFGGIWTFIKSEVNLTNEAWRCGQVTLGAGCSLPKEDPADYPISRQFKQIRYLRDRGAILFHDGEVRPGEAMLKMYRVQVGDKGLVDMSYVMKTSEVTDKDAKSGYGDDLPKIEIITPVEVSADVKSAH